MSYTKRKFEYRVLERLKPVSNLTPCANDDCEALNTLNDLGSRGWELCGRSGTGRSMGGFIFKREIMEEE